MVIALAPATGIDRKIDRYLVARNLFGSYKKEFTLGQQEEMPDSMQVTTRLLSLEEKKKNRRKKKALLTY